MKSPLLVATPLVAAVAWSIALIVDAGIYNGGSVLLIGLALLAMATISVVGILVAGGRWARRLALVSVTATLLVAITRPLDIFWIVGLAVSSLAAVAMFLPGVTDRVRKLPAAVGPPARAVLTPLVLAATPFIIGITTPDANWAAFVVGLTALAAGLMYARVFTGGLWAVRIVWPVLAIGLSPVIGWPNGLVSLVVGVAILVLVWHPSVKTAYHPPREVGSTFPIPPELAPQEILDAAEIDDRGRPR